MSEVAPPAAATAPVAKPSAIEGVKEASHQLRGTIAEELLNQFDHFDSDAVHLLKNHGTYQQDDRDSRGRKGPDGKPLEKAFMFMVRTRVPGGKITAPQFLAELDLADQYGNGTLRITTRQGFQHHGVLKENLRATIRGINEIKLTTLAACGDVNRNVMCCPAPIRNSPVRDQMQVFTDQLAEHFKPKTTAYWEIWLRDDEGADHSVCNFAPVEEPIYGSHYLPRKFKIGVALPEDNCIDIHANDMGYLTVVENDQIVGYNILVGGGMGMTPSAKKTFPALSKPLCFATPEQAIAIGEAVVKVQRDFGNRSDRKQARLKYLINNWGMEAFREKVAEYYGAPLTPPRDVHVTGVDDHLGWHEQGDGKWFLGINVENGRIKDDGKLRMKSGLYAIIQKYGMETRLTALQSVILCDILPEQRADINQLLSDYGIPFAEDLTLLRRYSIACPAWPTCGLSITEAERALPGLLDELDLELAKQGLSTERISVHMTGCPNGCARPYTPDIGLVGKAAGEKYTLYLGGNVLGTRLGFIYEDSIVKDDIVPKLAPVLTLFKASRTTGESFGDYCARIGVEGLKSQLGEAAQN